MAGSVTATVVVEAYVGGGGSATSSVSICTVISSAAPQAPLRSRARTESSYSPARVGVQVNWVVSSELPLRVTRATRLPSTRSSAVDSPSGSVTFDTTVRGPGE